MGLKLRVQQTAGNCLTTSVIKTVLYGAGLFSPVHVTLVPSHVVCDPCYIKKVILGLKIIARG
jgi:hypothetical protein